MEIAVGAIIAVFSLLVGVILSLRRLKTKREAVLVQRYPNSRLTISSANFFGQQSKGVGQVRGNGTLLITKDALVFEMWLPQHELVIPLQSITGIDTPKSFLGKSQFVPLLMVEFTNADGEADAAAWRVPDIDAVRQALGGR